MSQSLPAVLLTAVLSAALAAVQPCVAFAEQDASSETAESTEPSSDGDVQGDISELERKVQILSEELRKLIETQNIPEEPELIADYGLGPAAAKVYGVDRGLSIGGYGEFNYKNSIGGGDDVYDFLRFVIYLGYKFNDWIIFNSETEIEHASTSENDKDGSVSLEFAYLDFLLADWANVRAGLVLIPMGFINEMHEPPFYHGNDRPAVERQLIPSTWRANGLGVYGEILPGLDYRTFVVTSMRADRFDSDNIRSGRQKGNRDKAEDFSWVGRLDYEPTPGLTFATSIYLGNQGQGDDVVTERDLAGDPIDTGKVDAFMQMYEGHVQWLYEGLELRALGVFIDLDDVEELSVNAEEPIGSQMYGWYTELAYNVLPLLLDTEHYLAPWVRYSRFNTQADVASGFSKDKSQDREDYEFGLTYKPIPQVVIKADYRNRDAKSGNPPDEFRLGAGFVF